MIGKTARNRVRGRRGAYGLSALFIAAAAAAVFPAAAAAEDEEFHIKPGASAWGERSSYDEDAVPGSGDIVVVPAGATVTVADDGSYGKVMEIKKIVPAGNDSTIVFEVAEDAVRTNGAAIRGASSQEGVVIKRGGGELVFTSVSRAVSSGQCHDYHVGCITVAGGTLRLPVSAPPREYCYTELAVSNNATLVLPTKGSGSGSFFAVCDRLTGEGSVTCSATTEIRINGYCSFAGSIDGSAKYFSGGRVMLAGTNSTTTLPMTARNFDTARMPDGPGTTGVMKFGKVGEPSSLGTASAFISGYKGGGFLYLGEGEETDKSFRVARDGVAGIPSFIDAGAHGGVTFMGPWAQDKDGHRRLESIYLYGSNATPCVISATISNYVYGVTNLAFHLVKRGTGKWRMADGFEQRFAGGITVEEGTMQFDSIGEKGVYSAVGTSDRLFQPVVATYNDSLAVDYAFALGATNASGKATTEGVFEYTGTNGTVVWSRPLVLKGHGRVKTDSAKPFRFRGVSALGAGEHTLTLDGTGAGLNEIADITDGAGRVSVVKEGSGSWTLGGTNTFSGDLDVRGGRLTVRNVVATNYTWFLFTVKQLKGSKMLQMTELGLYNSSSNRVSTSLSGRSNYAELAPGQVAVASPRPEAFFNQDNTYVARLFNGSGSDDSGWRVYHSVGGSNAYAEKDAPSTWFPVMFRLSGADSVVSSYDIAIRNGAAGSNSGYNPRMFSLQGSVDGLHWDVLDDVQDAMAWDDWSKNGGMVMPESKGNDCWCWYYTTNKATSAAIATHAGKPIRGTTDVEYPTLTNVRSVSVSGNAVLAVEGDPIEVDDLSVDCAGGGGTISNFTFAASGLIQVKNATAARSQRLPLNIVDCPDVLSLADWTLGVDHGSCAARNYRLEVRGGDVFLTRPGLVFAVK